MKNLFLFLLFLLPVFFCNAAERAVSEKSTGKNLVKMPANALLIDFFDPLDTESIFQIIQNLLL